LDEHLHGYGDRTPDVYFDGFVDGDGYADLDIESYSYGEFDLDFDV
jgi:hypothetical protein